MAKKLIGLTANGIVLPMKENYTQGDLGELLLYSPPQVRRLLTEGHVLSFQKKGRYFITFKEMQRVVETYGGKTIWEEG